MGYRIHFDMRPNVKLVTIKDNLKNVKALLAELVLQPRLNALKWSHITKQTPNIKIGYPGQHLASLITGMEGERTGARGNDLRDGSEVKSCSRIDALDKCKDCAAAVARIETRCSECNSDRIKRNNDSKWLFTIRTEDELTMLTKGVGRVLLMLADYPNFHRDDFETLKFQAFEIWPGSPRNKRFAELMSNYYTKIYLEHKKEDAAKSPAPKNFWPYSYQFYLCNPIPVFSCTVTRANTSPKISVDHYVEPTMDRSSLPSLSMPIGILGEEELDILFTKARPDEIRRCLVKGTRLPSKEEWQRFGYDHKAAIFSDINENLRAYLPLRDTDRIATAKTAYRRRGH